MKKLLVCALALAMVLSMSASALAFEPVPKEEIKVGFVYIGDISDGGYTMAHHNGTLAMQEALGLSDDQIIIKRNVPENSDCEIALMELVEQGCDIIFGISFGYMEYMADLAEQVSRRDLLPLLRLYVQRYQLQQLFWPHLRGSLPDRYRRWPAHGKQSPGLCGRHADA